MMQASVSRLAAIAENVAPSARRIAPPAPESEDKGQR